MLHLLPIQTESGLEAGTAAFAIDTIIQESSQPEIRWIQLQQTRSPGIWKTCGVLWLFLLHYVDRVRISL